MDPLLSLLVLVKKYTHNVREASWHIKAGSPGVSFEASFEASLSPSWSVSCVVVGLSTVALGAGRGSVAP